MGPTVRLACSASIRLRTEIYPLAAFTQFGRCPSTMYAQQSLGHKLSRRMRYYWRNFRTRYRFGLIVVVVAAFFVVDIATQIIAMVRAMIHGRGDLSQFRFVVLILPCRVREPLRRFRNLLCRSSSNRRRPYLPGPSSSSYYYARRRRLPIGSLVSGRD